MSALSPGTTLSGSVSVLLGNGDGTFQAPLTVAPVNIPTSVAVDDFNRDGKPDLAVTNLNSNDAAAVLFSNDEATPPGPRPVLTGARDASGPGGGLRGDRAPARAPAN